ncbi:calpain-C-like [Centruroides sculpturatus]|uniref:calpain-C-like n=1 Tax=Centruroides sculpturatus TaxID=218467 RepID=UPI000C6D401C|nr:calpain-C-like [Centruroides sculpturatus]
MSEYERLKRSCLKRGELFEDSEFPACQQSVFYHQTPPFQFVWKRVKEICPNPIFFNDGCMQLDIVPGKLGDRWFVSCISCLNMIRGLFHQVVPINQKFSSEDYAGIFYFNIWWCGKWREVVVDDKLPTINNKLIFVHSQHSNQFWPALLEKAYAKLHGSYEALKYGSSQDGLADLTGGVTEIVNIQQDPNTCSYILNKMLAMTSIITAVVQQQTSQSRNQTEKLANGIILGTNYRVISLDKVETVEGDQIQLVKLRNPLSMISDYVGNWCRNSSEWNKLTPENKHKKNLRNLQDGEFWMTYQDFVRTFTTLEIIHLDGDSSKEELSLRSRMCWYLKYYHGCWLRGVTAGGCRNNTDTFHINPQLQLVISDNDEVVISVAQHVVLEPKVIGFTIYQMQSFTTDTLQKSFFKKHKCLLNSQYSNSRQISTRCHLDQGLYIILPTTFESGQEAEFLLRVYSTKPVKLKLIDCTPATLKSAIIKAPALDSKICSYEAIFLQLADEHKTVNAFELQELLEACLPNDYVKSCATLEVCRQVVLALDSTGNGRLKFSDYKNLMCSLKMWQMAINTFGNHTKGTSGILRAEKLKDALIDIGFQLNVETLSLLALRYMRKDGTLRFGDFVSCILHLTVAFSKLFIYINKRILY